MPSKSLFFLLFSLTSFNCSNHNHRNTPDVPVNNSDYTKIAQILLPDGFTRISADSTTFGYFLRNLPLKKDNTVYKYNGEPKANQDAQFAVIDISVGNKDLQQCADAVMRLRAEYLFGQKRYAEIIFWDNENRKYAFAPPYTHENLLRYLQTVFGMCGSASLAQQLKKKEETRKINPGDVLIRGGFPGHAVIVTDVAENENGERIYQIAQSYMPAQNVHVLKNFRNEDLSPWYEAGDDEIIYTPEYTFKRSEWKEW